MSDEDLKRNIFSTYYDAILLKGCVSNNHSLAAIQVCHELTNRNKKREVGGLKKK